ncbi:DUF5667 domain-containing protein [Amycolatopsis acidicola]|uniref:DUF5667 domain-containing protein n=1 Tax=Amycolatopsis acidicola TaxID=2596893 RepID=UPI001FB71550|nr:DUF5667 domain-containing protein [Amycolatopsis acidicola]
MRSLGDATPDAAARDRIRSGILNRLDEGQRGPSRRRRVLAEVLAAAVALVIALGGIGLLLSRNALPGDALYGVKRAGETAELGLAFGDSAKAQKHLEFAANRLDEAKSLSQGDAEGYAATLADFRHEATVGTSMFTVLAMQAGGPSLEQLSSWAAQQSVKLASLRPSVPAAATGEYTSSAELVTSISDRAQGLLDRLNCFEITTGVPDGLGAVPSTSPCQPSSDAFTGGQPSVPVPAPAAPSSAPAAPVITSTQATVPSKAKPTEELPPASSSPTPTAVGPPIKAPTSEPLPTTVPWTPPVLSIPPLLPGLPGVGIG